MSIDWWTLGLQTVNFLVLVWLLQRFLYRPVLAIIARRQADIAGLMGQADTAKAVAEKLERDLAEQRAAIATERDRALEDARAQAERERKATLADARADADTLLAEARRALEEERRQAAVALQKDAAALGIEVARALLSTVPGPAVQPFLDSVCGMIAAMRTDERTQLAHTADDRAVQVVTSQPLPEADRALCRTRLTALLGNSVTLDFANDPALIAGIEVHFPNSILRNTWRDTLSATFKKLIPDEPAQRNP
jgi:F-type H+-transporting ATPase subunit b